MESTRPLTSSHRSAALLREICGGDIFLRGFDARFWDGVTLPSITAERTFTIDIRSESALRTAFLPPVDRNFGAAFATGLIDVDGSLVDAIRMFVKARDQRSPIKDARLAFDLLRTPKNGSVVKGVVLPGERHSRERDRAAISYHYDHPVEFYRAFLDRNLVYSCAYYDDGIDDLDAAQAAKLDYVLAKLRVEPGMTLLDIGCGYGSLVIRAAGQGVCAHGITLSQTQYDEANRRIAELGLEEFAKVDFRDYRDLEGLQYDRIASIGMVEHVGREKLRTYYQSAFKALRPGGLFLNHGIAEQSPGRDTPRNAFIEKYVFPDGDLVCISDSLAIAERAGLEVRDVENLREHYTRTLQTWVSRLEARRTQAESAADATAYRIWRLYMAASAVSFEHAWIAVFQSLLAKPDSEGRVNIPATRRDLYTLSS
jgi:cyclopropane-fatty-acyl-phospholipid synthase